MKRWKIVTSFLHDVLAVKNERGELIVDLQKVKWTKQMHETVNALVDKHNEEVKKGRK